MQGEETARGVGHGPGAAARAELVAAQAQSHGGSNKALTFSPTEGSGRHAHSGSQDPI